jgi:hypothetical protein
LSLTNVILAFLVIVLSIQTKLGIKVNILVDRASELWNGPSDDKKKGNKGSRSSGSGGHNSSQADYLDSPMMQTEMFPPAPTATAKSGNGTYDQMMRGSSNNAGLSDFASMMGPAAANSVLGGSFGSFF